jgi:putative tryptophan/tyrosine transport system substrate-binding protein
MKRRAVLILALTLALLPAPLAAEAQPTGKVYRIALASPSTPVAEMTEQGNRGYKAFFSELRRLGYVEGKNLVVERRSAEGRTERHADVVADLIQLKPDVIFAVSTRLARRFKAATTAIPIVGLTGDPVTGGLVASLSRPGGNLTGVSSMAGNEILGKQLELLLEAAPNASRVAFLVPREMPEGYSRAIRAASASAGRTLVFTLLGEPIQEPEYRRAFRAMAGERVQALLVAEFIENLDNRQVIVELARAARLPAMYPFPAFVDIGGLMSYGSDPVEYWRQLAGYVDRILKGANPGDLPYQLPTKFELVINLKTTKALGLTLPPSVLLRADQVIE